MNEETQAWALSELKRCLQALALPADAQRGLFPAFASVPDELALDFDHWCATAVAQHEFTADQLSALAGTDALLTKMSGAENAELWTDSALTDHLQWQEVRERARHVLQVFGWNVAASAPGDICSRLKRQREGKCSVNGTAEELR